MTTQWNQQLRRCKFSKVIESFEQDIEKQIDRKRPSRSKQMNRVQIIRTEICK